MSAHPLDRPVWNMLNGPQAALAVARGAAARIDARYGPFAAARDVGEEAQAALASLLGGPEDEIWLVEPEAWPAPPGTRVLRTAPLLQLVVEAPEAVRPDDVPTVLLDEGDAGEMAALARLTEPGPWGAMTHRYGQFHGLRGEDGRLVAMAGERMRPAPGLAEVSGVCTAPECRGKGFAGTLIRQVMAAQQARGETPFLHSYAGNEAAIALYRSLGFVPRREMMVTVLARE